MSLQVNDLFKSFKQGNRKVKVLKGLQFILNKGETLAIIGQSGSGKSTLLSLLCGIDRPDQGDIILDDTTFSTQNDDELGIMRSHKIGIVFQNFHLIPHLTALENVTLAAEILELPFAEQKGIELLSKVGLSHRLSHFPSQLSGGEKQRVAIARSLIIDPLFLLADEPSGSLDEKTGNDVISLLFDLVKDNKSGLVLVTHNNELAKRCDRLVKLENGILNEI